LGCYSLPFLPAKEALFYSWAALLVALIRISRFHNQLEDYYSVLAHHYSKSGETEKAMNYLLRDLRTAWLTSLNRSFAME
jgi:hypothetical protein